MEKVEGKVGMDVVEGPSSQREKTFRWVLRMKIGEG